MGGAAPLDTGPRCPSWGSLRGSFPPPTQGQEQEPRRHRPRAWRKGPSGRSTSWGVGASAGLDSGPPATN